LSRPSQHVERTPFELHGLIGGHYDARVVPPTDSNASGSVVVDEDDLFPADFSGLRVLLQKQSVV
jgi:hypothetical protein